MKLSVVIITYNSVKYIDSCLASIVSSDCYDPKFVELLIFDNHSIDTTASVVSKTYSQLKLIVCPENLGFAGGYNKAVEHASGEWLLILNPDTKFAPDTLGKVLQLASTSKAENRSIYVPLQLDYDTGAPLHCGQGMDPFGFPIDVGMNGNFFYADGAAILIEKADYRNIGGFDNDYFIIHEDIDLSWRARLLGYKLVRCKEIKIFHKRGHTIDQQNKKDRKLTTNLIRRYYGERNSVLNLLKNYSMFNLLWTLPVLLTMGFVEIILYTIIGNRALAKKYLESYKWNMKNLHETLKKRKEIQRRRVIADKEIMKHVYLGSAKLKLLVNGGIPNIDLK